jgi:hypothetical protein
MAEENYRLLCEKELNESWSIAEKLTDRVIRALDKENSDLSEEDLSLIRIAAGAFVERALVERAEQKSLFGIDLYSTSPCGLHPKEKCPCLREKCLMTDPPN